MRYNEIIESVDDDDDLFGRGLHHRIAAALLAQAEEDQRIADEERGLGDQIHRNVQNAEEFEEQARNYRYIADAFNQGMAQGVRVYRSLDRSWKGAVDDVVDIDLDMDFRDYVKQIPESADDDDLFGRTGGNFAGMSAQDVKDRWDELNDELYGYEAYWSDEDNAEFQQKESELKALMRYARIRFGEAFYQYLSNWREHSDAQYARWQERTRADPFNNRRYREDPRITKSGKINKQDQKTLARDIKDRVGTHRQPVLPENTDDDDLFSTSPKLDRRQALKAKTIRRIEKRDALNIQPGTRLMVKWDNGKYYKGKVVRLTPSGRVIAQVKFHNVGWPLEKNISPRDIKPEHILKETDDDMFAKNSQMSQNIKTNLKQIDDPYLRTVRTIRELAKTRYGAKIRVSGAPKTSARGRATVWVGDYDANYQIPKTTPEAYAVKNDLEQLGFDCRFTDAGWLSVKVPPMFSDLISEESDDELFGPEFNAETIGRAMGTDPNVYSAYITYPEYIGEWLYENRPKLFQQWNDLSEKQQWAMVDDVANAVYDITGDEDHAEPEYLPPPPGYEPTNESETDDELFGQEDGARLALKLFKMLRVAVARDPRGVSDMLKQYSNENSTLEQRVQYTLDYMAQAVGMSREMFDHYSDDFYMMPWPKDVDWRRPWQVWDAQVLDKIIEIIRRIIYGRDMNESDDDELFAPSGRERVMNYIANVITELRHEKQEAIDAEEVLWISEELEQVSDIYRAMKQNFQAGAEQLMSAAGSHGWADSLIVGMQDDGIPFHSVYSAPWLREDADDDELFGRTTLADRVKGLLQHKQKVRIAVSGAMGWVRGMRGSDVIIARTPRSTTRYVWPGLHSERAKNFELTQDPATRVWVVTDRADID